MAASQSRCSRFKSPVIISVCVRLVVISLLRVCHVDSVSVMIMKLKHCLIKNGEKNDNNNKNGSPIIH